jgi:hypothetical protein
MAGWGCCWRVRGGASSVAKRIATALTSTSRSLAKLLGIQSNTATKELPSS